MNKPYEKQYTVTNSLQYTLNTICLSTIAATLFAHRCILRVKVHHYILLPLERRQSDLGAVLVVHCKRWCIRTNLSCAYERWLDRAGGHGLLVLLLLLFWFSQQQKQVFDACNKK